MKHATAGQRADPCLFTRGRKGDAATRRAALACSMGSASSAPSLLALRSTPPSGSGYGETIPGPPPARSAAGGLLEARPGPSGTNPVHHTDGAVRRHGRAKGTQGITLAEPDTRGAFLHYVVAVRDQGLNMKTSAESRTAASSRASWPGRCCTRWACSRPARHQQCGQRCSRGGGRSGVNSSTATRCRHPGSPRPADPGLPGAAPERLAWTTAHWGPAIAPGRWPACSGPRSKGPGSRAS